MMKCSAITVCLPRESSRIGRGMGRSAGEGRPCRGCHSSFLGFEFLDKILMISFSSEANKTEKAVEAAIKAKEWNKAVQIVDSITDGTLGNKYYGAIADHYASQGDYDVRIGSPFQIRMKILIFKTHF